MKNIVSCNTLYETTFQNIIYVYSIFEKSNWQKKGEKYGFMHAQNNNTLL